MQEIVPSPGLDWPLPSAPRIAVAAPRLMLPAEARRFRHNEWKTLAAFAPEALAGPPRWIQLLLDRQRQRLLDLSASLAYPVLLLLKPDARAEAGLLRDRVWDTWGLPVFEQCRDGAGHLVAWECEAHGLFHATERFAGPTLYQAECACGLTSVRFVSPEQAPRRPIVRTAAAAD